MLHQLEKVYKRKRIRRGRGNARKGTSAGRGTKGQKARTGHKKMRPGFEGGRTPLARILPKRKGIGQNPQSYAAPISLDMLDVFKKGERVTLKTITAKGLVRKSEEHVKILGVGELKNPLIFVLPDWAISKSAKEKIAKAGGSYKGINGVEAPEPEKAEAKKAEPKKS